MEYLGIAFGIFGLLAFFQVTTLKSKVDALERQLAKVQGTSYSEDRQGLEQIVRSSMGQKVKIDMKEDYWDADILSYGNSKHGFNTILDVDGEWVLVRTESPKGSKDKLVRLDSIQSLATVDYKGPVKA